MRNLLLTKLYLPAPASNVATRRRLLAQLDRGLDKKLTLICAPAGFGKTTLVALWLRSLLDSDATARAAWYTIDETDDDLPTFLSYLVAAIRRAGASAGATALADWVELDHRPGAPGPEELTAELAQAVDTLPGRLIVVLDDYHFINDPNVHRLVSHLLRHLPPALHLVITARSDPPLGLSQLRARDQINELRAHHLAFSLEEAGRFFREMLGATIEPDVLAALWERTEGWAVGLRLAAASVGASGDRRRYIDHFQQHSNRHIMDYLVDEVLSSQPGEVHDFLLRTSILGRLSGELCGAVLDIEPRAAQAMLARLDRSNLFVVPLDDHGEWYRYHSQFQTMLRNRLHAHVAAAEIAALHGRAAAWLAGQDLVADALPHYLTADDRAGAAGLVERHIPEMLKQERWLRLGQWLALLPDALIEQRPALLLLRAWLAFHDANYSQIRPLVEQAEHLLRGGGWQAEADALWGQIHALLGSSGFAAGPAEEAIAHGQEALRLLPPSYTWTRAFVFNDLARWRLVRGEYPVARQMIEAEIAAAGPAASEYVVRLCYALASLHYFAGYIDDFYRVALRYEEAARQLDLQAPTKWAQLSLGMVHLERNEPEPALAYLGAVFAQPDQAHFHTLRLAAYGLLGLYAKQNRTAEAQEVLAALRRRLGAHPNSDNQREVEAIEAHWALLNGDLASAAQWVRAAEADPPILNVALRGEILIRNYLAFGGPADLARAAEMAHALLAGYRRLNHVGEQVPMLVLLARAYWQRKMTGPALAVLREALELGYPRGYRRAFTQHGAAMSEMLRVLARDPQFAAMAGHLLTEMSRLATAHQPWLQGQADGSELLIEPLTEREAEVLGLMAGELSNKEIAHRLGISPITVRNHTVNIYGKLHVESRRQAVRRAQQLGLLSSEK